MARKLSKSTATWKVVIGHHTIRSVGHHGDTKELVDKLLPLLEVNLYDPFLVSYLMYNELINFLLFCSSYRDTRSIYILMGMITISSILNVLKGSYHVIFCPIFVEMF